MSCLPPSLHFFLTEDEYAFLILVSHPSYNPTAYFYIEYQILFPARLVFCTMLPLEAVNNRVAITESRGPKAIVGHTKYSIASKQPLRPSRFLSIPKTCFFHCRLGAVYVYTRIMSICFRSLLTLVKSYSPLDLCFRQCFHSKLLLSAAIFPC